MAILTMFRHRFYKNDGTLNAGGKVWTYAAGTTTPTSTYTSSSGAVANTNPIILNSKGECDLWTNGLIKVNVLESDDTQVTGWPVDNIGSGVTNDDANARWAGTSTGTANAIAIAPSPAITAYAIGQSFIFKAGASPNSAATTIAISGLTPIAAQSNGAAMTGGEILANNFYMGVLDTLTTVQISKFGEPTLAELGAAAKGDINRFINGAMAVDKRNLGAAQTITAGAALAYTVDRWYGYCTGANVTGQRVAGTSPNQYNYQYTGAASVTKIAHAQRIEAANSQDLAGTTTTLSVDLANSLLTTVTWTAWYANTADTFGSLATPTRTSIGTGTFTVTSTLTRYSTNISIPSAATTGIEVEFSVAAQISGTWTIGRAQIEPGYIANQFEIRSIRQIEEECFKYSPVYNSNSTTSMLPCVGIGGDNTNCYSIFNFPVSPRVPITGLTVSNATHFSINDGVNTPACTAIVLQANNASGNCAYVKFSVTPGNCAANRPYHALFNNASGQILFTGCEL